MIKWFQRLFSDDRFCDQEYYHVWGNWTQYRTGIKNDILKQKRFCSVCNFCEDQLVTITGELEKLAEEVDVHTTNRN